MNTTPVVVQTPLAQNPLTKAFEIPHSIPERYRVEVIVPDGTTQIIYPCKAYTKGVFVDPAGMVKITLGGKQYNGVVPYPFHFLFRSEVLCAIKKNNVVVLSGGGVLTFGLNYDLFAFPWKLCFIVHNKDNERRVFFATRQEWDRGNIMTQNREPQMFLSIPEERHFDLSQLPLFADAGIVQWSKRVAASLTWKGV